MSGDATFSGTAFQAGAIAYIYVHILAEQRLGWFELSDDTPIAVSGEVNGPGDDARVEFRGAVLPIEIQAKHGLTGQAAFIPILNRLRGFEGNQPVVVLVDRASSSKWLYGTFADDLDRLRSGRADGLRANTKAVADTTGADAFQLLRRVHVKPVDLDDAHDPEAKLAIAVLQQILSEPNSAELAWKLLRDDAATVCAKRLRRTRNDLIQLLEAHHLRLGTPRPLLHVEHNLDLSKALVRRHKPEPALFVLAEVEKQLASVQPSGVVMYRFLQQRGAALGVIRFGGRVNYAA